MKKENIAILGSTGSIGKSSLDIIKKLMIQLFHLSGNRMRKKKVQ